MRVLIIGRGAREFAIGNKLKLSPDVSEIYYAPGNGATGITFSNVSIKELDFENITTFVKEKMIDMVIVGPEEPIVKGIRDFLSENMKNYQKNLAIICPNKKCAQLEGDKAFAKNFIKKYKIPTPDFLIVTKDNIKEGIDYLESTNYPIVLKAAGLCGGKGVFVVFEKKDAIQTLKDFISGKSKFGKEASKVVIEEYMEGYELSVFILTNGIEYTLLPTAMDYKKLEDNDKGPNTGGMGSIAPHPLVSSSLLEKIKKKVIEPTLAGLQSEGMNYRGFLYFGLMIKNDEPFVLEYNVRLGDPEAQSILPLIIDDLALILYEFEIRDEFPLGKSCSLSMMKSLSLVIASKGYPDNYETNKIITGIEKVKYSLISWGGVSYKDNCFYTDGGRVLTLTAIAPNFQIARNTAYQDASYIHFENCYYRKDIGLLDKYQK